MCRINSRDFRAGGASGKSTIRNSYARGIPPGTGLKKYGEIGGKDLRDIDGVLMSRIGNWCAPAEPATKTLSVYRAFKCCRYCMGA